MSRLKVFAVVVCLVLAFGVCLPSARADEWNERTELTFNQPVEIPGVVLPAGTYWFILANSQGNRNIVQVFGENWKTLYATELTVPTLRAESTDHTVIRFAERPHTAPDAILKWYYPGRDTGHQFLYHSKEERRLDRDAKLTISTEPMNQIYSASVSG
ncbi:MAG TPA: hypothetical protein VMG31_04820 [Verrucomicrobiae bacterium]|nr:hypothetical protein [Verrucomicrobiae bacterium]